MSLLKLLDRPITFHRVFVDLTGSINAALLLSQAVYWTNRLPPEREGWFYKTKEEWTAETGLSRKEQDKARERLGELGLIESRRAKVSDADCVTALWHRVNETGLLAALEATTKSPKGTFAKSPFGTPQKPQRGDWSQFRSKNIDYSQETPPPPRAVLFSMSESWQPAAATGDLLIADGIPAEFIAHCLPEFRLYWLSRNENSPDAAWQGRFIRQVRSEFAFQNQQEARRHEQSEARRRVSGIPSQQSRRPRKETITERCERYDRYAAGLDASIDATERARNARKTDADTIPGEFTRH